MNWLFYSICFWFYSISTVSIPISSAFKYLALRVLDKRKSRKRALNTFNYLTYYLIFYRLQGRGLENRLKCLLSHLIKYVDFKIIWPDSTSSIKQNKAKSKKKRSACISTKDQFSIVRQLTFLAVCTDI